MTTYHELNAVSWPAAAEAVAGDGAILGLIQRGISGEESAYVALYNHFAGMIYRLSYSLLQDRQDAEEVLQDSFEYAFRRLDQYDARKASFKTWLYRIAISRCHNKRRRKWLPTFSLSQWVDRPITDTETPAPEEASMLTGQQQMVWQALSQLSPKLRETAVLRYYEGLSYSEIGEVLAIPAKTVESRMRLAHKALKELLVDEMGNV